MTLKQELNFRSVWRFVDTCDHILATYGQCCNFFRPEGSTLYDDRVDLAILGLHSSCVQKNTSNFAWISNLKVTLVTSDFGSFMCPRGKIIDPFIGRSSNNLILERNHPLGQVCLRYVSTHKVCCLESQNNRTAIGTTSNPILSLISTRFAHNLKRIKNISQKEFVAEERSISSDPIFVKQAKRDYCTTCWLLMYRLSVLHIA